MGDLAQVGGKNASLGEMVSHLSDLGVRVPGGFATTADAYRSFLAADGLYERIKDAVEAIDVEDVTELARVGSLIRSWIEQQPFPADLDAETTRRVQEAALLLGLGAVLERKPGTLSGGQRQRVAVGRAIVRQPKVFLFDEPLSNLDAAMRSAMRIEISKLHARLGATMIYVTHDQVEAMTMGDRICVMQDGRVAQLDEPLALYHRPRSLFTAGFIGAPPMNLLTGQADGSRFIAGGAELALPVAAPRAGTLILGLRPEHTDLTPNGRWPMKVEMIEMLGAERLVYGRLGDALFTVRVDATLPSPALGDTVRLDATPEHLHWFDAGTGQRV